MSIILDQRTGLPAHEKQSNESRVYTVNFEAVLGVNTISAVTASVENLGRVTGSTALNLGAGTYSGKNAQVRCEDGTDREDYKVTFLVTDSGGNTLEDEIVVLVRDR